VKPLKINKKILAKLFILPILFSLSGCVYLVVGGVGAVGGYVVSPDTIEGITENDSTSVWDSTIEIISIMGIITESQEEGGIIMAKIQGARVTVTITPISQSTSKLSVKARKSWLPKISVSQEVYVKVMSYLNE